MATVEGFLAFDEIDAIVRRVTYKPGWIIRAIDGVYEGVRLRIVVEGVMNSYHPSTTMDLGVWDFIPNVRDEQQLLDFLLWRVLRIESHEAREFFRVDGKLLYDPHRPVDREL